MTRRSARLEIGAPAAEARHVLRRLDRLGFNQKSFHRSAVPEPDRPDPERSRDPGDKVAEAAAVERPDLGLDRRACALSDPQQSRFGRSGARQREQTVVGRRFDFTRKRRAEVDEKFPGLLDAVINGMDNSP